MEQLNDPDIGLLLQEVETGQRPQWKDIADRSSTYKSYWATCYLVMRQIICGFWIYYLDLLDKSSGRITINYNTLNVTVIALR
jgi:hypothetical protein